MAADNRLAAELDAIEQRQETGSLFDFATADSPRLLKALRSVLELAARWSAEPIPSTSHAGSVRAANVLRACGDSLERAISRELIGSKEDGTDDG
jgi:hypothetical protein